MEEDLEKIVNILQKPDRLFEDLEFMIYYLQQFDELKKHFRLLNPVIITSLCRQFSLKTFKKQEFIFNQGEPVQNFYLILKGTVSLYEGKKFISRLTQGKVIGERELSKNYPFSYTGLASSQTLLLLSLEKSDFATYLNEIIAKESQDKMSYLKMLIPNIQKLSNFVLEKLMQGIRVESYFKGESIVAKGNISEHLLLLVDGECSLIENSGLYNKEIVRIGKGSVFGEESIFYNTPSQFTLQSKSDCVIAYIRKVDVLSSFPDYVLRNLKSNYEIKKLQRSHSHGSEAKLEDSSFPLASDYAKKKLAAIVSRSNKLSPSRLLDYHQKLYGDFKDMLTEMRDTSPKRVMMPNVRRSLDLDSMKLSFS